VTDLEINIKLILFSCFSHLLIVNAPCLVTCVEQSPVELLELVDLSTLWTHLRLFTQQRSARSRA